MNLNEYQESAMSTCMASCHNFAYMSNGIVGEVGEFFSKVAKGIRKEQYRVSENQFQQRADFTEEEVMSEALKAELGDILWFVAGIADIAHWTLEDVAKGNLEKLAARKVAGTIDGNGDGISGKDRTV